MLKLHRLLVEATTADGRYGADIAFEDGLNVVRADNSAGKSTCLQGAMYALGLEPMLGPRHEIPLPHAMTDSLDGLGGQQLAVIESKVVVEASNRAGEFLTFERFVKREGVDHRLVFVRRGQALSEPGAMQPAEEFFARGPGSATREAGLGRLLADFIGWELPTFTVPDASETRLYLESVFPLLYVEQKRGWGGIHRYVPPYAQIGNVRQRAFEFLMKLDVLETMRRRTELQRLQQELRRAWSSTLVELQGTLGGTGFLADGFPGEPVATWPPAVLPQLATPTPSGEWESVGQARVRLRARLDELDRPAPAAGEVASDVEQELQALDESLHVVSERVEALEAQLELEREQSLTMMRRIDILRADELRYQDALTIQRYGGTTLVERLGRDCPTCGQHLPSVLNPNQLPDPMPLQENLDHLREQRRVFQALRAESDRLVAVREREREALYGDMRRIQRQIRSARATLVAPEDAPAEAVIRDRIEVGNQLESLDRAEHAFDLAFARFSDLTGRWAEVVSALRALPDDAMSTGDHEKISALRQSFVDQLEVYGFSSVRPTDLEISRETYQPSLKESISASTSPPATGSGLSGRICSGWSRLLAITTRTIRGSSCSMSQASRARTL
jgi:hypothetical protein